jgi:hypothetical protein
MAWCVVKHRDNFKKQEKKEKKEGRKRRKQI